ncbi:MAG: hypothetical protein ACYTG0_10895 [Planctomycetota bacterium]|jgi:hypothetical protein
MLKLSIGLTRETGEADSPSYSASAGLEVELDPEMIDRPDRLREHARQLFSLAGEALGQELNLRDSLDHHRIVPGDGLHNNHRCSRRGRRASRAQILAVHALATRRGIDLDGLLRDRYRVCQLYELSVSEAGELIGELQAAGTPKDNNVEATAE